MSALGLEPPYPGPWTTNREGAVLAADGQLIGYCRFERVGMLPQMQAASRWWAAGPSLVDATIALTLAGHVARKALAAPDRAEAAASAVQSAQALAIDALRRLRDPMLVEGAGYNAPITTLLGQLSKVLR